jgi:hypothetical protein
MPLQRQIDEAVRQAQAQRLRGVFERTDSDGPNLEDNIRRNVLTRNAMLSEIKRREEAEQQRREGLREERQEQERQEVERREREREAAERLERHRRQAAKWRHRARMQHNSWRG